MDSSLTDLLHLGVRFYEPGVGRFSQVDPIRETVYATVYSYAQADPALHTDASGECIDLIRCFWRWYKVMNAYPKCKRKYPLPDPEDECQQEYIDRIVKCIDDEIGSAGYLEKTIEICTQAGLMRQLPGCRGRY